jgi:tetratricopeptide (TPR) repeat protein
MGNEERRGGIGFGNPRGRADDDDAPEATRAMDLDDLAPAPTEFVKAPAPPPPGARAPLQRPSPPMAKASPPPPARPAPRPAAPPPIEEEDQSTRMLEAMDFDPSELGGTPIAPQAPLRTIELRIVSGPDRGKAHKILPGTSLVGRGLDCQIVLADPAVSRKHFKLERQDDEVVLFDLGGANGTNVNGSKSARHVMQPGDHVEIGTSVLEFYLEGAVVKRKDARGSDRPMSEVRSGKSSGQKQKSGPGKMVAIAAAGLVVLGGGATAAYLLLKKAPDKTAAPAAAAEVAGENPKLKKLLNDARTSIDGSDFAAAQDTLKEAKALDPENSQVKDLLKLVRKEVDNQETLDEAKQLAKGGDFDGAMKKFAEIDEKSALHADAQEELNATRESLVSARLADAKKAQDAGDNAAALKALDAVLKVDPKRAEAKAMRDQLSGGAAAPEAAKADDKKPEGKAEAKGPAQAAVAPSAQAAAKESPAGNKKADFGAGMSAYHAKQWSAAMQAFDAVAQGPFPKDAKAKAAGYAAAVKAVQDAMNDASAPGVSPRKAVNAYKAAYNADKRLDGSLGGFLAGKIADSYIAIAKDSFAKKQYADAAEAAGEAQNFVPDKPEAQQIVDKCNAQAAVMLKLAKEHLEKKNYGEARDLARQVAHILPASDKRAQEAQEIAKKANEANNQDDN